MPHLPSRAITGLASPPLPRAEIGNKGSASSAVNTQNSAIIGIGGLAPAGVGQPPAAGNFQIRFPVRIKLLLAVFALLTITVAAITAFMARKFGDDKIAYVNDVAAIVADSTAAESAALLRGYLHDMSLLAAIESGPDTEPASKARLTARIFERFPEFVSVSVVVDESGVAATTIDNRKALAALGIVGKDLVTRALAAVSTTASADAATTRIGTVMMPGTEPLLVLAESLPPLRDQPARILLACLRLKELADAVERGRGFGSALVDSSGKVLVAGGRFAGAGAAGAAPAWIQPMLEVQTPSQVGVVTREFTADKIQYIGARTAARVAGVITVTAIPRSAAYLTARDLLDNLMLVSMALIVAGAVVALLISRRLTKPLEQLALGAERIGQGDFDTRVHAESSDEMGALAVAFNRMASGLQERELALIQAQRALVHSAKMAAFGQLGAGIAHEVNNPLAGILGHAQLAIRRLGQENPAKASLDLIAQETRRCIDIIKNLMRFARQETLEFKPVDANDAVGAALSIVDHQLSLHGIRIVRDLGESLPQVNGDINQLQQVLVNLAINAQQAMAGQRGELSVRTRAVGGQVLIELQDTGPGISPELQKKIFEPFFTTKPAGQGTGLGLSVSYGIIESHGGRIEVRSSLGSGATFVISLPVATAEPAPVVEHHRGLTEAMST
jgi:two-component system NtrC family sensor kinase